jgi:CRISPR/Cas system CSM-associated protein Csm4 (group 5 of RAMP superfamily)
MERNMFIGNQSTGGGVRAFLDRIDVLSTYLSIFPPILNVAYQELPNQEIMLFDALPNDYVDQIKKANQVPLEELRSYALNIEETKVNEVKNSNSTEAKGNSNNNNTPSQKNGKGNGKRKFKKGKKNGQGNHTSATLDWQAKPICSFCGNIDHVENTCRAR